MKKTLFVIIFIFALVFPGSSHAHSIGQQPYFKVNGVFTDYYPVAATSLKDFKLPHDIVVGKFLVNEEMSFEIDTKALPIPEQSLEKTKFLWDFGDGSKAEGLKNTHKYSKAGTYFLDISVDSGDGFAPQILQSTAINILPNKNYVLPKSIIEVNGKQAKDPMIDVLDVNFSSEIKFDGRKSQAGSSEIVSYSWDLGDQSEMQGISFSYKYTESPYTVFPVLRIKTKDGFIVDSFIQIKDESTFDQSFSKAGLPDIDWKIIGGAFIASAVAAGVLTWVISRFFLKKRK